MTVRDCQWQLVISRGVIHRLTGDYAGNESDCVKHGWKRENSDADLVSEEDQGRLVIYYQILIAH